MHVTWKRYFPIGLVPSMQKSSKSFYLGNVTLVKGIIKLR
jgi:hypothetical protein